MVIDNGVTHIVQSGEITVARGTTINYIHLDGRKKQQRQKREYPAMTPGAIRLRAYSKCHPEKDRDSNAR